MITKEDNQDCVVVKSSFASEVNCGVLVNNVDTYPLASGVMVALAWGVVVVGDIVFVRGFPLWETLLVSFGGMGVLVTQNPFVKALTYVVSPVWKRVRSRRVNEICAAVVKPYEEKVPSDTVSQVIQTYISPLNITALEFPKDEFSKALYKIKVSLYLSSLVGRVSAKNPKHNEIIQKVEELFNEVERAETVEDITAVVVEVFDEILPALGEAPFTAYLDNKIAPAEEKHRKGVIDKDKFMFFLSDIQGTPSLTSTSSRWNHKYTNIHEKNLDEWFDKIGKNPYGVGLKDSGTSSSSESSKKTKETTNTLSGMELRDTGLLRDKTIEYKVKAFYKFAKDWGDCPDLVLYYKDELLALYADMWDS